MASKAPAHQGIPLIGPLLNKIIGTRNERFVKRYTQRVAAINALEPEIRKLTDAEIRGKIHEFRARLEKGEKPADLLVEAFAIAREAMDRAVGIRNIFNPNHSGEFDVSRLPAPLRETYARIKAEAEALPPAPPEGEWLGGTEPVPGGRQVSIPNELYEAVRELYPESRPPFRARPFDVQLIGGMVLYQGKIAEMKTGEGKTIVAPLATYLACVEGLKVHVVTVNDYLVQRDRDWVFPFFHALGLTVGAIHPIHMQDERTKRDMYRCDVVYGTTSEFGFDYLRDNMKRSVEQQVQRVRQFAIVDEVDSILIDEARTPLIISGPAHEDAPRYDMADRLARHLVEKQKPWQRADDALQEALKRIKGLEGDIRNARDKSVVPELTRQLKELRASIPALERERSRHTQYYEVELDKKQCYLTHEGIAEAQRVAQVGSFYVGENMDLPHLLEQALRGHVVYQRDRDYIVAPQENPQTGRVEPSVVIVDTFTGRPMVGRQWSDGLHQAIEAKEGVPIKQETQTVATITIQNFFKMYQRLAGMTGTADTEAQEFHDIYKLDVVAIPTNRPVRRRDYDDLMFLVGKDKWAAIVDEIKTFHDVGRPILVGTTSVEKSEMLSQMLTRKHGIRHEVLNAKQHEREAQIVENAGQLGQVMIATNMAGRGTDIKLGTCTREALLEHWLRRGLAPRTLTVEATDEQLREAVYRKIGASELNQARLEGEPEVTRREVEEMPFADLELRLLRAWARMYTWLTPRKIDTMSADALRKSLDDHGRFLLHRLRWFTTIEDMGGLHVIGTERHESRRIDNQLRGRSGRQGDNGSSRFFVSLDDELMKLFAGERTMKILATLGMKEGDAIEHPMLSKSVERAQRKVEDRNFQIRKNILEYDEVMEHQRQVFYGLRQRVLEGRDVRGLIFGYIQDAVADAVETYLDRDYAAECAAEHAKQVLDCSIAPDRLRGRDLAEMEARIRADAKDEVRQMIAVTIGEYMPDAGGEFSMDFDAEGLAKWARTHFGVELSAAELLEKGPGARREVQAALVEAAERRIDSADLSGLAKFVAKDYGARELSAWAERKFGITVPPEQIMQAQQNGPEAVEDLFLKQTEELYTKREIEYPVDFALDMTMSLMRQNPQLAMDQLIRWANQRYGLGWTPETLRTMGPREAREKLLEASKRFVEEDRINREIEAALAADTGNDALEKHLRERLNIALPETVRRAKGQERENAVRAAVESQLRMELLFFERTMLLETLDPSWKDHLYAMDQLRGAIGFRAFSQQDPRIEFKREGSRLFSQMMENVRDKVTDYVFKLKLTAAPPPPPGIGAPPGVRPAMPARPAAPAPAARPAAGMGIGGMISGPGLEMLATPPIAPAAPIPPSPPLQPVPAAAPASERQQRDLEAAQRAGADGPAKPAQVVKAEKRLGRNDPCPMGSGRKFKKCCNNPDGICNGEGLTRAPQEQEAETEVEEA